VNLDNFRANDRAIKLTAERFLRAFEDNKRTGFTCVERLLRRFRGSDPGNVLRRGKNIYARQTRRAYAIVLMACSYLERESTDHLARGG
jgi:hypothetical protein